MAKTYGLGRGLGSLIPSRSEQDAEAGNLDVIVGGEEKVSPIPITDIKANPHQPRTDFDHDALEDLMNSVKEHGILQPLIVTKSAKGYELVAGERRFRAAQALGLKTVPAIVRDFDEQQKLELALVENIQRRDLNPIEEAVAYQRLIDEFSLTQDEVAKKIGKSRSSVTNTLRLLTLPTEIQRALITGKITQSTARVIVGLPAEERLKFFHTVLSQDLTVRAAESAARNVAVKKHVRRAKDPNVSAVEERLQAALGTKVAVKKNHGSGTVVIDFYSEEELGQIVERICD